MNTQARVYYKSLYLFAEFRDFWPRWQVEYRYDHERADFINVIDDVFFHDFEEKSSNDCRILYIIWDYLHKDVYN